MAAGSLKGLCVEYELLLWIDSMRISPGYENVTSDDVYQYFQYNIKMSWAANILRRLYNWGLLHRKKENKQNRRGPRKYVYRISESGIKKCDRLFEQGFSFEKIVEANKLIQ